jgi:hypothetical protein
MNAISFFTRLVLGALLAVSPLTADAKPRNERGKQKTAAAAGQARQKAPKAPQRTARQSAPRQHKVAKAQPQRSAGKAARSKPSATAAKERSVSPAAKGSKSTASRADRRHEKQAPSQRIRENDLPASAAVKERGKPARNAAIAKADRNEIDRPDGERDLTRAERKDARKDERIETAQEKDRRAQRVSERERIAKNRRQQIANDQERRRDRVERFRDNRQRRFAAVQRQRAALRAARVAARREYREEVREEIREYWEDRAEEVRDRVRDRRDYLFDDDWWERRHWYHGPILVSSPWWWWQPVRWGAVNVFINAGWGEPIAYDYGTDVIYDDDEVYFRGEPVGSRVEYTRSVVELANPPIPAVAEAPVVEENWQPLGVWALVQEEKGDAVMFFQLSVNREGIISGAYANVMSGEEQPIVGRVDRKTQRAAWHIGDQKDKVFEAGMANLTHDQASCLAHLGNGETQNWLLVRMPGPTLPDKPATLGQIN